ncbi:MAG: efflux RND transporter permease subunit [Chryseobacterium sp.]|nr:MAG: efflux RND transporter permease subunit [Chryseobacterium sp.]
MVKFLLHRPIAVFLSFIVSVGFGLFFFTKIPTSLLPAIDVPEIIVKINYPNTSAKVIEQNITSKMRDYLVTLEHLEDIESQSANHNALIKLTFNYGTKMDLSFIEVNEKLDRILNELPKDLPRPVVTRVNTADIPIVRIQVIPKSPADYLQISALVQKIIKKRIERIQGVSVVDINGAQTGMIAVEPDRLALNAAGLTEESIASAIRGANVGTGAMSVKDGQYRYFLKLKNRLDDVEEISSIPLMLSDSSTTTLGKFVRIGIQAQVPQGYHLYKGKQGLVMTVQKQVNARMGSVLKEIENELQSFKKDYPKADFYTTQDQTFLLDQGIQNLTQDLWFGGILCVVLLFLFLGNFASPILMSISIPVSLCLTFVFFYFLDISFNIISLSGLALGIGMLIDNSIVVLDSITRRRKEGFDVDQSCIIGVKDVVSPVISNVLTTVAIYGPLIYLSGLAGALVYDQAVALTISLAVSLLVAFVLNPVMYRYFLRGKSAALREDTKLYLRILNGYHSMITHIFSYKKTYFWITIAVMPLGFFLFKMVPVETLPRITETETQVKIDWNQSLDADGNLNRMLNITSKLENKTIAWEADLGLRQFLLQHDDNSLQKGEIYYKCSSQTAKNDLDSIISKTIRKDYPDARFSVESAPNAFTQLFKNDEPYLEAKFKAYSSLENDSSESKIQLVMMQVGRGYHPGISSSSEASISLKLDTYKMSMYGISQEQLQKTLSRIFGVGNITELKRFAESTQINFSAGEGNLQQKLEEPVFSASGAGYPIKTFVSYLAQSDKKYIVADKSGIYNSVYFSKGKDESIPLLMERISKSAAKQGLSVSYAGKYFSDSILAGDMLIIFFISLVLLYLILAIQFENLVHPFLVMFTIPLGIGGAMLLLWLAGGTLNVMTAIGFVVVLGIIVDDPSLKVETINRLREEYLADGMKNKREILLKALHNAGEICLKPLLMVSLTTSLALLPVLFTGGIGNDLQKPMVYVIVGGLTLGTFLTLWFIPLAYWFITKKSK